MNNQTEYMFDFQDFMTDILLSDPSTVYKHHCEYSVRHNIKRIEKTTTRNTELQYMMREINNMLRHHKVTKPTPKPVIKYGNLITPLTIGVLDILGIYCSVSEIPEHILTGIIHHGCYSSIRIRVRKSNAPIWDNWKPLKTHILDIPMSTADAWELHVVYGTRNCAYNVDSTEVMSILRCIFDTPIITRI